MISEVRAESQPTMQVILSLRNRLCNGGGGGRGPGLVTLQEGRRASPSQRPRSSSRESRTCPHLGGEPSTPRAVGAPAAWAAPSWVVTPLPAPGEGSEAFWNKPGSETRQSRDAVMPRRVCTRVCARAGVHACSGPHVLCHSSVQSGAGENCREITRRAGPVSTATPEPAPCQGGCEGPTCSVSGNEK